MQQGVVWMSVSFSLPRGQDLLCGCGSPVPEITNQHEAGDMDPFPPLMFVSFDAGELIITGNPNCAPTTAAASKSISIIYTLNTHSCREKVYIHSAVQELHLLRIIDDLQSQSVCWGIAKHSLITWVIFRRKNLYASLYFNHKCFRILNRFWMLQWK